MLISLTLKFHSLPNTSSHSQLCLLIHMQDWTINICKLKLEFNNTKLWITITYKFVWLIFEWQKVPREIHCNPLSSLPITVACTLIIVEHTIVTTATEMNQANIHMPLKVRQPTSADNPSNDLRSNFQCFQHQHVHKMALCECSISRRMAHVDLKPWPPCGALNSIWT